VCAALKVHENYVKYHITIAFQTLRLNQGRQPIFRYHYTETIYELKTAGYLSAAELLCFGAISYQYLMSSSDLPDFHKKILDRLSLKDGEVLHL
jgi:hypothetical protein